MTQLTKALFAAVCLAIAGGLLFHFFTKKHPGADEGAHMVFFKCMSEKCATEYAVKEHDDLGGRNMQECPACNGEAESSARCPSCGKYHVLTELGRYQLECPHCGAKMPSLVEQLEDAERELG